MKNTKVLFISITSVITLLSSQGMQAAPAFEIYNKDKESIQVNIADISGNIRKDKATAYVSPNQQWNSGSRAISLNDKLLIEISTKKNPRLTKFVIDAPKRTKYLSWNPAKSPSLYPQTGPLMGLMGLVGMGQTKSGLSLENNVKASDIQTEAQYNISNRSRR
jgi:hypothetical protein